MTTVQSKFQKKKKKIAEFLCETEGCQFGKKHIRTSADMEFPALCFFHLTSFFDFVLNCAKSREW